MKIDNIEIEETSKTDKPQLLRCDHCGIKKQCQKIVYNQFGNVIFMCKSCIDRSYAGHFPKILLK